MARVRESVIPRVDDVIINPYRYAGGGGGGGLPWVHVWDCTAISGSTIPDIVGSADLTLAGSAYIADSTGIDTNSDAYAYIDKSLLDLDIGNGGDAFTLIMAVSAYYSGGEFGSGRYIDGQSGTGIVIWNYQNRPDYLNFYDVLPSMELTNGLDTCSRTIIGNNSDGLCQVDTEYEYLTQTGAYGYIGSTRLQFFNRQSGDRALDSQVVGLGIVSKTLTQQEFAEAGDYLIAL